MKARCSCGTRLSAGNDSGTGGGILSGGTLTVRSSTIASNTGHWETGGIVAWGATRFKNTIVARNWGYPTNCYEAVHSTGHNLENGRSCGFTRASDVRANPRLGPLRDNGGPTFTHQLLSGSPAIDAGGPAFPPTDQRGVVRPQGPASDIGAFEADAQRCETVGTPGNDVIVGTRGDEVIWESR